MSDSLRPRGLEHARLPVLQYLPEFAQTRIHWVSDAIQPSHPPSPPSPTFNLSQHQGLLQWVGSLHQVAKVLELQHHSLQWIFWVDLLDSVEKITIHCMMWCNFPLVFLGKYWVDLGYGRWEKEGNSYYFPHYSSHIPFGLKRVVHPNVVRRMLLNFLGTVLHRF